MSDGCQYIGPEQVKWPYTMCGCKTLQGKVYCADHYHKIYAKGTSVNGKRRERAVEAEIADIKLQQEIEEITNG